MKKTVAIFLFCIMSFNICYALPPDIDDVPFASEVRQVLAAENSWDNAFALLSYIGALTVPKDEIKPKKTVSRGEVARLLSRMLIREIPTGQTAFFDDVPPGSEYADDVNAAYSLGIAEKTSMFYPNRAVTFDELAQMLINTLGYRELSVNQSPLAYATRLGIFKNIDTSDKITFDTMMIILENAMSVDAVNVVSLSEESSSITINKNLSFMEQKYGIRRVNGILTGVGQNLLYSGSALQTGQIQINRAPFNCSVDINARYVGLNVFAYADANDEDTIFHLWQQENRNLQFTIDKKDFYTMDESEIEYYDKNGFLRKYMFDSRAIVMLNGVHLGNIGTALGSVKLEDISEISLIDNNSDNMFDVIKILAFEYYVVNRVSEFSSIITFMYGKGALDTSEKGVQVDITLDGEKIGVNQLKQRDVLALAVAYSQSGETIITITASRNKMSGQLNEILLENEKTIYVVNNERYEITAEYEEFLIEEIEENKPVLGEFSDFLLSHDGKIAASVSDGGFQYGYLKAAGQESGIDPLCKMKIYTIEGQHLTVTLRDSVTMYHPDFVNFNKLVKADQALNSIVNVETGVVKEEVIAFKQSESGEVTELAVPMDRTLFAPGTIDYPLTKDYEIFVEGNDEKARCYRQVFARKYSMTNNIPILQHPSQQNDKQDDKQYGIAHSGSYGVEKYFDQERVILYNVNKFFVPQFYVNASSTNETIYDDTQAIIVDRISQSIDSEGMNVRKVTYIQSGNEASKSISTEAIVVNDGGKWISQLDNVDMLAPGDIIQFVTSSTEEIRAIRPLFSISERGKYKVKAIDSLAELNEKDATLMQGLTVIHGKAIDVRDKILLINTSDNGDNDIHTYPIALGHEVYKAVSYTLFDSNKKKTYTVDIAEIQPGDDLVVQKHYNHGLNVFIIR